MVSKYTKPTKKKQKQISFISFKKRFLSKRKREERNSPGESRYPLRSTATTRNTHISSQHRSAQKVSGERKEKSNKVE